MIRPEQWRAALQLSCHVCLQTVFYPIFSSAYIFERFITQDSLTSWLGHLGTHKTYIKREEESNYASFNQLAL